MKIKNNKYRELYDKAHNAGLMAGNSYKPNPMIVQQHASVLDDNSPVVESYYVSGGVCGFAWIRIRGNTGFAKWCRENDKGHNGYPSGWDIWVSEFGQSMEKKERYADEFARILNDNGIEAHSQSRMD